MDLKLLFAAISIVCLIPKIGVADVNVLTKHVLGTVVDEIIAVLGWENFTMIVDSTSSSVGASVYGILAKRGILGTVAQHSNGYPAGSLVKELVKGDRNLVVICKDQSIIDILYWVSANKLLSDYYAWIFVFHDNDPWLFNWDTLEILSNNSLLLVTVSHQCVLKVGSESNTANNSLNVVGTWTKDEGLILENLENPMHTYGPIENKFFVVAILHDPPYAFLNETKEGLQAKGYDVDVFRVLAASMGFRYKFVRGKDNLYGQLVNGTWNGLLGILQRKEADLVVPSFSRTDERVKVTDISAPISNAYSRFLIRKPGDAAVLHAYTSPFHLHVWLVAFCAIFLLIVSFIIVLRCSPFVDPKCYREGVITLALMTGIGIVCQRESYHEPKVASERVLLLTFLITSLVSFSCYSSVLMAFLTVSNLAIPFDNIAQIIDNKEYTVGYVKGTAYEEQLQPNDSPNGANPQLYNRLYRKIYENPDKNLVATNLDGVMKAYNEKYAFFSWVDGMLWDLRGNSSFVFIKEQYMNRYYGLPFRKNSPYVEAFSIQILKLIESGVLKKLKRQYFVPLDALATSTSTLGPIDMEQFFSVFLVLAIGISASLVTAILECFWSRHNVAAKCKMVPLCRV